MALGLGDLGSVGRIITPGPTIFQVSFTGDTAAPTVITSGHGFGATSPAGISDNSTNCGSYSNDRSCGHGRRRPGCPACASAPAQPT